ncbi:MAG TPA: hypothetical protein VFF68_04050 [Anaerolineaceae bacterium]|nr:hypothetical protein [Anaerolineaceae bacterium]
MNLVTHTLLQQIGPHPVTGFVESWDPFEAAVIRVYKSGKVLEEDRAILLAAQDELKQTYPRWVEALQPFWRQVLLDGSPVQADPFLELLAFTDPESFVKNWTAMQTLPVAREAINRYLWEQIS